MVVVDGDVSIRLWVECASQHARLTNTKNKQHKILSGIQNTPKQDTVIPPIQPEHFCQPRKNTPSYTIFRKKMKHVIAYTETLRVQRF